MNHRKGFSFVIILVLLAVAIALFLCFFYKSNSSEVVHISELSDDIKTYTSKVHDFSLNYPNSWKYVVLHEDTLNSIIQFYPKETFNININQALYSEDEGVVKRTVETTAPVKIEINKILSEKTDITQLVKSYCTKQSYCDYESLENIRVAGMDSKKVAKIPPFQGEIIFFLKEYLGTEPSGQYLFKVSKREDEQTQNLFDLEEIKNTFESIIESFEFDVNGR